MGKRDERIRTISSSLQKRSKLCIFLYTRTKDKNFVQSNCPDAANFEDMVDKYSHRELIDIILNVILAMRDKTY